MRRKLQEKKKMRGFVPRDRGEDPSKWRLQGTLRGRIEVLKSKTRCHLCKKVGHWKKECPSRGDRGAKFSKNNKDEKDAHLSEVHQSEVWIMDEASDDRAHDLWESIMTKASQPEVFKKKS